MSLSHQTKYYEKINVNRSIGNNSSKLRNKGIFHVKQQYRFNGGRQCDGQYNARYNGHHEYGHNYSRQHDNENGFSNYC